MQRCCACAVSAYVRALCNTGIFACTYATLPDKGAAPKSLLCHYQKVAPLFFTCVHLMNHDTWPGKRRGGNMHLTSRNVRNAMTKQAKKFAGKSERGVAVIKLLLPPQKSRDLYLFICGQSFLWQKRDLFMCGNCHKVCANTDRFE